MGGRGRGARGAERGPDTCAGSHPRPHRGTAREHEPASEIAATQFAGSIGLRGARSSSRGARFPARADAGPCGGDRRGLRRLRAGSWTPRRPGPPDAAVQSGATSHRGARGAGRRRPPGSPRRWPLPEQFACDDPEAALLHLTSVTKVVWSLTLSGQSPKGRKALRPLLTPRPVVGQEAGRTRTRTRGKSAGAGRQVGAPVTPVRRGRGLRGLRSRRKHPRGRASERARARGAGPAGGAAGTPPPLCRGGPRRASAFHQRWRLGPRTSSGGQRGIRTSWQEIRLRRVGPCKALTNPF